MKMFLLNQSKISRVEKNRLGHKLEVLFLLSLGCATIAAVDTITPPEVPLDALYTLPIWFGLVEFGLAGGVSVASGAIGLFYLSNYVISHDDQTSLAASLSLTYLLLLGFTYAAYHYLRKQQQLERLRCSSPQLTQDLSHVEKKKVEGAAANLKLIEPDWVEQRSLEHKFNRDH